LRLALRLSDLAVLLCAFFTSMAWLWWNVVGCVVGVLAAIIAQAVLPRTLRVASRELTEP